MVSTKITQNFNEAQQDAVNPMHSAFVQANAGTGKTAVLTGRLLRILFSMRSLDSAGIVCLTYTKAGASEMNNRILGEMRKLAIADDETLAELVYDIVKPRAVTPQDITHARNIFYAYIDNPEILTVKTIHSFCEDILHRFPLEAGLSPAWNFITDSMQNRLWHESFSRMIDTAKRKPADSQRILNAFEHVLDTVSDADRSVNKLIERLSKQYKYFFKLENFDNYRKYFIDTTRKILNLENPISEEVSTEYLQNIIMAAKSAKNKPTTAEKIITNTQQFIDKTIDFEKYKYTYLKSSDDKKLAAKNMLDDGLVLAEQDRVFELDQQHKRQKIFDDTVALFELSSEFAQAYKQIKKEYNLLDFEDLILYTKQLFTNQETMGWILSQLNMSISHVLVDEAQDTSPDQWDVITALTSTIMSVPGYDNLPPTLFVVGDTKQSIYSFQGAEPAKFADSREIFERQIAESRLVFREPVLDINYRSYKPILNTVDEVFNNIDGFINNAHKCSPSNENKIGLVEVHQMQDVKTEGVTLLRYLDDIADRIDKLVNQEGIKPSEIMILVCSRDPMAPMIIKKLKRRNISVAGSDKIILPEFSVIRDFMHLIRFCIKPTNNYSLCCVLKSPMFDLNEDDIFNICKIKNDENKRRLDNDPDAQLMTVFDVLETTHPDIHSYLKQVIKWAQQYSAYTFFTHVLEHNDTRHKIMAALGSSIVLEPLDEFMNLCLSYERTEPGTMRDFIKWFITSSSEVKRDVNHSNGVRVMTVHGSKGLQSRVVFLIDTATLPYMDSQDVIQVSVDTMNKLNVPFNSIFPLPWLQYPSSKIEDKNVMQIRADANAADMAEYYRLLYVAMTRACERLYIYGIKNGRTHGGPTTWISRVWDILSRDETRFTDQTKQIIRITNGKN